MSVTIKDHSKECKEEMQKRTMLALDAIGAVVAGKAKELAPVDTGALRADIRYEVAPDENAVIHWQHRGNPLCKVSGVRHFKNESTSLLETRGNREQGRHPPYLAGCL